MSATREQIVTAMCYTWRHDYGLDKISSGGFDSYFSAGMTKQEREFLWKQMAQLFDNDIAPNMDFKK